MLLQVLITIGAAQALTLALLILLKRQRSQADYFLALNLGLMFAIIMLYNYRKELCEGFLNLPINCFALGYLAVSVLYLYIKSAARGALDLLRPANLLHFLPFIVVNIILVVNFYGLDPAGKLQLLEGIKTNANDTPFWFQSIYYGLFLGLFPVYLLKSFRELRRHEQCILRRFSFTEEVSLGWFSRFLLGMTVVWLAFIIFEVVANHWFSLTGELGFQLAFLAMIINIFLLGIYGLRQRHIFFDFSEGAQAEGQAADEPDKYVHSSLTDDRAEQYLRQLRHYMEEEKPYLEPKISIAELAQRSAIPVNYLSQIINDRLGQNFFDFINAYRVEEFKRLAQDPANQSYTLLSLAYDAGFNSKSTFNAIFKKATGLTPSEYTRQLQERGSFPLANA